MSWDDDEETDAVTSGSERPHYLYSVDGEDRLVTLNSWWLAFARENGAAGLSEEAVLGCSLWNFIADDATRRTYAKIHARLREHGGRVALTFRCDSPSLERQMRMAISASDAGRIDYDCAVIRAVPTPLNGMIASGQRRSQSILTVCSCCKRAMVEPLGWLEIGDASDKVMGSTASAKSPQLRYTLCGDCGRLIDAAIENGNAA